MRRGRLAVAGLGVAALIVARPAAQAGRGQAVGEPEVRSFEAAMVAAPPATLGLDPFYTRYADAFGIPIVSSDRVAPTAVLMARDIVNYMLSKRPDLREALVARGSRVMVMAYTEQQLDLPEYRDWKKPAFDDRRLTDGERRRYYEPGGIASMSDADYWNRRARGMGGVRTSCAEENLLGRPGSRYYGEHICVHEFSHGIHAAIRAVDPALAAEIQASYDAARAAGLFAGHYAANTVAEYFAEGTQWWFWSNFLWEDRSREPAVRVWSPDDLQTYDPRLYAILDRVYPGHHIPADIYYGRDLRRNR
ncbi:MAG: hypothetical protein R2752_07075 [Vicinamibacterales bacterium]